MHIEAKPREERRLEMGALDTWPIADFRIAGWWQSGVVAEWDGSIHVLKHNPAFRRFHVYRLIGGR